MWILFTSENLKALRFKSSLVFLKRPPVGTRLDIKSIVPDAGIKCKDK